MIRTRPNYFGRWAAAKRLHRRIVEHVQSGRTVVISTCTRAWKFTKPAHLESLECRHEGLYLRRGKSWDYVGLCAYRFF